jgi:hypothetical protein
MAKPQFALFWAVLLAVLTACEERRSQPSPVVPPAATVGRPLVGAPPLAAPFDDVAQPEPEVRPGEVGPAEAQPSDDETLVAGAKPLGVTEQGGIVGEYIIDGLVDVGAAGPASASPQGVVMVNRHDEVSLAPLGPRSTSNRPVTTPITPLSRNAGPFPLARGPGVYDGYVYWVAKGRLLRRELRAGKVGELQVLRSDARSGTRVAVPVGAAAQAAGNPLVGYIARQHDRRPVAPGSAGAAGSAVAEPEEPPDPFAQATPNEVLIARLWRADGPPVDLTPEASSTSSMALVAFPGGYLSLALEGRTGISLLHARTLARHGRELRLSDNTVVWVGGGTQPLTEILALGIRERAWGFIALERDITRFGLVELAFERKGLGEFGAAPPPEAKVAWYLYANGIDPAPSFPSVVCGRPLIAFAQPISAHPDAPQQLCLLGLDAREDEELAVVGSSRAFFDVSLSAIPGGALLAYGADRRTWARTIRCRKQL